MDTTQAIRISEFGGPEVLDHREVELPAPGPGEVVLAHTAIGLNMVDTYFRSGLYPLPLPSGLGSEGAGVVQAVGPGVNEFVPGERVAYASPPPLDAYSRHRVIDASRLVQMPDSLSDSTAAAMMLKGMTSWYLLRRSYRVQPGDTILLYAAAGGTGSIIAQWASASGARVIGVVGSEPKRALAEANGCEHVLLMGDDIVARVRELTDGEGVPVVYDSIGRTTFMQSLDCLRPHGVMVSFGNASGPVEPVSPLELLKRGSLYLTRPSLWHFIGERTELEEASRDLFEMVTTGKLAINVNQEFPLTEVAEAHRRLERRQTTGCSVLIP